MTDTTAASPTNEAPGLDLFTDFATDVSLEEDGVWEPYGQGVSFLIARSGTKKFNRALRLLATKNRALLAGNSDAAVRKSDEVFAEVMSKTVLLGWKGDFNWKGAPMGAYTSEKAYQMLLVKDFREWVKNLSEDQARFKAVQDETEAGE